MTKYQKLDNRQGDVINTHEEGFSLIYVDDNSPSHSHNNSNHADNSDNFSHSYSHKAGDRQSLANAAALDADDSTMEVPLLNNNNASAIHRKLTCLNY